MTTKEQIKYKAIVKSGDKTYKAEGETLLDAFNNLKIAHLVKEKPLKTELTASRGKKSITKIFNMGKIRRFAGNPITRNIWAKMLEPVL